MNASVEWLSAFVESGLSAEALRDLLTARTATVDAVERLGADLSGIVVARVLAADRHPDSDHLWVTQVDGGGSEPVQVICGAPNVGVGVLYPFAPVGTTMPNGMKIERRKIRGELSNGMLCSARELGLGADHEGILALTIDATPGTRLTDVMPIGDSRLVIDVSPSRPDLLCHLGVAREIAAATGLPVRSPAMPVDQSVYVAAPRRVTGSGTAADVRVTVDDPADCPAYLGVVIRGVHVAPSPEWLTTRLAAAGLRSVNNVVDATNYMLLGYGQPMHAFDLGLLVGGEVHVRRAREGESIKTLDDADRRLDPSMLVIADAARPQGIAGVIGGHESQVTAETTDLFLEVATFDPIGVRRTRRALGVTTDASHRFERLVPPSLPLETYAIAVRLLMAVAGGKVDGSAVLVGQASPPTAPIRLRSRRVAVLLGIPVPVDECAALLRTVGFAVTAAGDDLFVTPPSWRTDARGEIDLVEEVARLRGYETFPDELRPFRLGTSSDDPIVALSSQLRELLSGHGFLELRPMPFAAAAAPDGRSVPVINPLADTEAYLRRDVVSSLARSAEFNLAHMEGNLRLFEIGTVFQSATGNQQPREEVRVGVLCMGARRPPHFTEPDPPAWDAWDVKALAESVAGAVWPGQAISLVPGVTSGPLWHVKAGDATVGLVSQVSLDAPPWASPAFGIEMRIAVTETTAVAPPGEHAATAAPARLAAQVVGRYQAPPAQPAIYFDLTLTVPVGVTAGAIERSINDARDQLLEGTRLLSEYRDPGEIDGPRYLTWRLTFRHPDRTLREKEVEARRDKLLRALESQLGVRQRTT